MKSTAIRWYSIGLALAVSQVVVAQQRGGGRQAFPQPEPTRQAVVGEIPGVVSDGAQWKLVWQGTDNADGIVGTPDGGLLFAQEQPNRILKLDANDKASVYLEDTHGAGALAVDADGRIVAVERTCTDPGKQPASCTEPTAVGVLAPERNWQRGSRAGSTGV